MNKPEQNVVNEKVERTGPTVSDKTGNSVHSTPGGPGWVSLHSRILWIGGIALVVAAWIAYMIIDN